MKVCNYGQWESSRVESEGISELDFIGDFDMGWATRLFRSKVNKESDPILSRCKFVLDSCDLQVDEDEWRAIVRNRDVVASSILAGAYVHKDVFKVICYLCPFDGLFERGSELIQNKDFHSAILSLEKANKLLQWPSVLYAVALCFEFLGDEEKAIKYYKKAVHNNDKRNEIISRIIPDSTPSREEFIKLTADRLDSSSALSLGYRNMQDLIRVANEKVKGNA